MGKSCSALLNVNRELEGITEYFAPYVIAGVNDHLVKIAKIKGDKVPWHHHENEDELFYIVEGELLMEIVDEDSFYMRQGDLFVVGKGISHRVSSVEECLIILIETNTTQHTGNVSCDITRTLGDQFKKQQ